jgi:hypothetical protein
VHKPNEHWTKLDSKNKCCIMVGYFDDFEAFRCYHPPTCKILTNRDDKFDGRKFWHPLIDLSSKPLVYFEQISDQSIAIKIIDPPTSYAFIHLLFKFLNQLFLWFGFSRNFFSCCKVEHISLPHVIGCSTWLVDSTHGCKMCLPKWVNYKRCMPQTILWVHRSSLKHKVCKSKKTLHKLSQSPRAWHEWIDFFL